jgi:hypothetical protein
VPLWRQDTLKAAEPASEAVTPWAAVGPEGIVVQRLTVARVAGGLGVASGTAKRRGPRREQVGAL